MKKFVVVLVSCVVLAGSLFAQGQIDGAIPPKSPIGIISAMDSEVAYLLSITNESSTKEIGGVVYHVGQLEGKDVVICKAGVGKSLSAAGTAILIHEFNVSSIIFTGIAGAVSDKLSIADVVISTEVMFHDFGFQTDEGIILGTDFVSEVRIPADPVLVEKAYEAAMAVCEGHDVFKGLIATGDQFVASAKTVAHLSKDLGAMCVEMEGASVGYVASQYGVPFVVIRSMSDKADGVAHETYDQWWVVVSDNSGRIVQKMVGSM